MPVVQQTTQTSKESYMIFVRPELIRRVVEALRQIECRIRTRIADERHRIWCSMEMPDMAPTVLSLIKAIEMRFGIATAENHGYIALRERRDIAIAAY